jgi:V/A-type H+-transporting ATPase subunit E
MSEIALDQLIAKLKKEAVEAAEKEQAEILAAARRQAEQIVTAAEEKSERLISEAEEQAQDILSKGKAALQQAGRDLSLSVRNDLLQMLAAVLKTEVEMEFTPDLIKRSVEKMIDQIGSEVEVRLPADHYEAVASYLQKQLQSSEQYITMVKQEEALKGFSLAHGKEGWAYAVTPEEVADAMYRYLSPHWVNVFKGQ